MHPDGNAMALFLLILRESSAQMLALSKHPPQRGGANSARLRCCAGARGPRLRAARGGVRASAGGDGGAGDPGGEYGGGGGRRRRQRHAAAVTLAR